MRPTQASNEQVKCSQLSMLARRSSVQLALINKLSSVIGEPPGEDSRNARCAAGARSPDQLASAGPAWIKPQTRPTTE